MEFIAEDENFVTFSMALNIKSWLSEQTEPSHRAIGAGAGGIFASDRSDDF